MGATAQVLLHLLVWENIVGLAKEIKKNLKKKDIFQNSVFQDILYHFSGSLNYLSSFIESF